MHFIVNDQSLEGQFNNQAAFQDGLQTILQMRTRIKKSGFELKVSQLLYQSQVTKDAHLESCVRQLPKDQKSAVMQWLTKGGPFWDSDRRHSSEDWLELAPDGQRVVTDSGLGEAAWLLAQGESACVVSFVPSKFDYSPLLVIHRENETSKWQQDVPNHFDLATLAESLKNSRPPLNSWRDLEDRAKQDCEFLVFSDDAFRPLDREPFVRGSAEALFRLVGTLNSLRAEFTDGSGYSAKGQEIFRNHFSGEKPQFTDSSRTEKETYAEELSFRHPDNPGEKISASWHGKENYNKYRVHFSFPIQANESTYVVYVGPKITKR